MAILMRMAGWLMTPTGSAIAGVLVLFGVWQMDRYNQRQKGAADALVSVQKKTEAINEKARAARNAAGGPGAADRVRKHYCIDC
jgi:hypothetical protein